MTDFAQELEDAAALTATLVKGLRWLEREGPSEGQLQYICNDIQRLAEQFKNALDKTNERTHGKEIDKLRGLLQTVRSVSSRLNETQNELYLRLHVLDALENLDKTQQKEK